MNALPHLATVLVAIVAALSAFATQRQASRANHRIQTEGFRSEMEKEAFERARAFDTDTIIRQNQLVSKQRREIDRLSKEVTQLSKENRRLEDELGDCMRSQGSGLDAR